MLGGIWEIAFRRELLSGVRWRRLVRCGRAGRRGWRPHRAVSASQSIGPGVYGEHVHVERHLAEIHDR
jgi:hypothetical protein